MSGTRVRAVALLLGAALLSGCRPKSTDDLRAVDPAMSRVSVRVAAVERGAIDDTIQLVGTLLPRRRTIIVSEVDGVIQEIPSLADAPSVTIDGKTISLPLDIGAEVRKGDLLCQLDASDYALSLEVARAGWNAAVKDLENLLAWKRPEEVAQARARLDEAKAVLTRAQSEYERIVRLRQQGSISNSEYDDKVALASQAKAMFDQAEATFQIAQEGPTEEEAAVAQAAVAMAEAQVKNAQWKVDKTTIVAPYDAVVTDRYVDVGDRVTAMPRVEIMEIADVSLVLAEVGVPERYANNVQVGDQAEVVVAGFNQPFIGNVAMINSKVEPTTRMFRMRVALDNTKRELRTGQFVRVRIRVSSREGTLTVPRPALTYSGGQPQVFVLDNDAVELRRVELGIQAEDRVEVATGLNEGERVVVHDPAVLTDGMPVQIGTSSDEATSGGRAS